MAEDYSLCKHMKPSKSKNFISICQDLTQMISKGMIFRSTIEMLNTPKFKDDYVTKLDASQKFGNHFVTMFEKR
ncbi:MAG: hypothetical protein CM15mP73_1100 [Hyphomicrobiales bacterium]|nr:MAG: hypothetical protein CM15mP73_1100 [Hyphomicrobiales bacterium]